MTGWVVRTRDAMGRVVDEHLVRAETPKDAYESVEVLLVAPYHIEVEAISAEDFEALSAKQARGTN